AKVPEPERKRLVGPGTQKFAAAREGEEIRGLLPAGEQKLHQHRSIGYDRYAGLPDCLRPAAVDGERRRCELDLIDAGLQEKGRGDCVSSDATATAVPSGRKEEIGVHGHDRVAGVAGSAGVFTECKHSRGTLSPGWPLEPRQADRTSLPRL